MSIWTYLVIMAIIWSERYRRISRLNGEKQIIRVSFSGFWEKNIIIVHLQLKM